MPVPAPRRSRGLNLSVPDGEFLVLIGASGSGKTTTLNMVNRLVEPDGGEIRIDGAECRWSRTRSMLRRRIGYVFQEAGLFPHMTVAENIAHHAAPAGLGRCADRRARAMSCSTLVRLDRKAISATGLPARTVRRPAPARRRWPARWPPRPTIMLMDEPFGALDPVTRDDRRRRLSAKSMSSWA